MDLFLGVLYSQLVIALLLFIHEMGHYLALKSLKIKVDTFSIGIGKGLTLFNYKGTDFKLSPILLGAYVKPNAEDYEAAHPYKRLIVSLAGSTLGILAAIVPFFILSVKYLHLDFIESIKIAFLCVWELTNVFLHLVGKFFVWAYDMVFHIHKDVVVAVSKTASTSSVTDRAGKFSDNYTFMQGADFGKALIIFALLSVFINLVNLIPLLPLDGGHVLVHTYEIIFKKSPPKWLFTSILLFGVAILISLLLLSIFNDVKRFF